MKAPDTSPEETILSTALHYAPAERSTYLDRACAGDPALRQRLEEHLRARPQLQEFMKDPNDLGASGPQEAVRLVPPAEEGPGTRIGCYKLLQKLGEGGCGVVYMAEQEEPVRRKVALKVIKLGMDTRQMVARFGAERQALALMDHPNIAKVLEAGATDTGRPYFVMELVGGIKITDYCDQNNLTTRQRLDLFIQVCRAIEHAHQKGVIHRDIKPSNILVTTQDGVPMPKVIDFGIAKAMQGRLTDQTLFTALEQFIGTPAYMSPERAQLGSLDVDTRSDVYSLGVLLYELLTGKTPFAAESLNALLDQVLNQEPTPPRLLNAAIPVDLDSICLKCLEKDPAHRYSSALLLGEDLGRFLNDEPVSARPVVLTDFTQTHWADEAFGRNYLESADFYLPDRSRFFQVFRFFFRYHLAGRRSLRVCDLGCGDGVLAAQLLAIDPTVTLMLVDGSNEMLEAARRRFASRANTHYVQATFDLIIKREVRVGPADFFVSSFAIHHLNLAEKALLFQRIFEELQPGGWFLNIDSVLPDHEVFTKWLLELWREQIAELESVHRPPVSFCQAPDQVWNDPDNKFSPLGAQLKALRAAGFGEVECHYRNGLFALYTGRKPGVAPSAVS